MGFGNVKSPAGLKALNEFLSDKSYIEGYVPSQADVVVYEALSGTPTADLFHALRWYNQVKSYSSVFSSLPGVKKPIDQYGPAGGAPAGGDDSDSDSDEDLFGSDNTEELAKVKAKLAASAKPKKTVIAKSNIILDVKPWEDTTNMQEIEDHCRGIVIDGLLWGASKLVPLAYGVKKLQISCVIEDDKVSVDDIEEKIKEMEEHVQSVDIAAFNKI